MVFGRLDLLARDYEVPKRPIFVLENDWDIVQGTDAAAYVSCGVTDGVMYGTNGNIGLRHRSESETVGFRTCLFLNGVYHNAPLDTYIDCESLPDGMQVGATVCEVGLDCLVDGESGTLRAMPTHRMNMRDGIYYSQCLDVMSGDGGLMFDASYRRVVSMKEVDLWGAEVVYTGFRLSGSGSSVSDLGVHDFNQTENLPPFSYTLEFLVTFKIGLSEWQFLRGESLDDLLQQSLTSDVVVSTLSQTTCVVNYGANSIKIAPEQDIYRTGADFFPHNRPLPMITSDSESDAALIRGVSSSFLNSPNEQDDCVTFKRRFVLNLKTRQIPESVTLTFLARHQSERVLIPHPFPEFSEIVALQHVIFDEFWNSFHIDLQPQDELIPDRIRLSLRFNAFRLFCVTRNIHKGLPRSGCSASKRNLQYDLQQYVFHGIFYIFTLPQHALGLIQSLYSLLPQARKNAHCISLKHGAIYPRSTIKGTECRYYTTVTHARLHVNAEIGYVINLFFKAVEKISTSDRLWLLELMLETSRVWPQLGDWIESDFVFRLDNIAGGDEYNGSASGNFYIHLSAKMHMRYALELYNSQRSIVGEEAIASLLKNIGMDESELNTMRSTSDCIVLRRNDHLGVYMVHNYFNTLTEWKCERPKHPLSMNYHPLAIFRHQLVDIPEVLLGMLLYDDEFEDKEVLRNLAYYEPLCTFDSPVSLGIVAAMEFRSKGRIVRGMQHLRSLLSLDLDNIIYTAEEGLDFGAMSASWMAIVAGIGGVKLNTRSLHIDPFLPAGVNAVSFSLCWRGSTLRTTINQDCITYELVAGDSIRFVHAQGHRIHLHVGFRHCAAKTQMSVPRLLSSGRGEFDGAIFLCESLFDNVMNVNYMAWYNTLESVFENYRALRQCEIPSLTAEEYIEKVIYQAEDKEIAFSGIHNVLLDRGIDIELGSPDDAEIVETRYGLANAKVAEMGDILSRTAPKVNPKMRALLKDLANNGIALAVTTYSRNLKDLMHHNPDISSLFLASIDGEEAHDRHIKSRPHVDLFLRAAEKIHVLPERCVVFSAHLDRGYKVSSLAMFRMFFDIEDPFVAERFALQAYPVASSDDLSERDARPLVIRLPLETFPTTIDALEDILYE